MRNLQDNVFVFQATLEGTVYADRNNDRRRNPGENGLAGGTVALTNSAGIDQVMSDIGSARRSRV